MQQFLGGASSPFATMMQELGPISGSHGILAADSAESVFSN
jgi:hypothetical protein